MYQMLVQIRINSSRHHAAVFLFPPLTFFTTLVIDGVNRLATSASDILIWESLYFSDFPDVVDKPYPLVAD